MMRWWVLMLLFSNSCQAMSSEESKFTLPEEIKLYILCLSIADQVRLKAADQANLNTENPDTFTDTLRYIWDLMKVNRQWSNLINDSFLWSRLNLIPALSTKYDIPSHRIAFLMGMRATLDWLFKSNYQPSQEDWAQELQELIENEPTPADTIYIMRAAPLISFYLRENIMLMAIKTGNLAIVRVLLDGHFDVNYEFEYKYTPLMVAIDHDQTQLAQEIMKHPLINLNAQDSYGLTALQHALVHRNSDIAYDLVIAGADPTIKNNDSQDALAIVRAQDTD